MISTLTEHTAFLPVFRALHPDHHGDAYLQFRLRLLKFVSVLDSRRLRLQNYYLEPHRQGPQKYESAINVGGNSSPPNKSAIRTDNDTVNLDQLKPSASPSLLDTLPHFMALSAAQLMLQGSHITDIWMKLAAGYMTHAVLEQYFALGEHDPDVIRSTFAWGFDEQSAAEEGSEEFQINAMFFDEDKDRQVAGWDKTREDHTNAVCRERQSETPFWLLIKYLMISLFHRLARLQWLTIKLLLLMSFHQWILSNG